MGTLNWESRVTQDRNLHKRRVGGVQLWDGGDRAGALEAIPDSVVDDLVVHGSPEECRARILRYTDAGVELPIVMPLPVGMSTHEAALRLSPAGG